MISLKQIDVDCIEFPEGGNDDHGVPYTDLVPIFI